MLDDRQIAALNQDYLKRTGPTDVLSFPMRTASFPQVQPEVLGDVVISVETALRQAHRRSVSFDDELSRLLVHGILHLLGYDHETSARDARAMRARERAVFRSIHGDAEDMFHNAVKSDCTVSDTAGDVIERA